MHMETDYAAFQQRPLKHHIVQAALQIPTLSLVQLDSFKQGLEISSTETLVIVSLDDLKEKCWSVLHDFGEDLQQVAVVIIVNQDVKFLNLVQVFGNFYFGLL